MFRFCGAVLLGVALVVGAAQARTINFNDEAANSFTGPVFDWLLREDLLLVPDAGEPGALALVAKALREGDPRAAGALQNYLDRYPQDPAAFDLAGTHLLSTGEFTQAALALKHSLRLSSPAPWTRAKLGMALENLGQPSAARRQFERALDHDPVNPVALRGLQSLAIAEGDLVAATRYGERALAAFGLPRSSVNRAHVDLADLYMQAGRWEDAFDILSPVLQADRLDVPDGFAAAVLGRLAQVATELGAPAPARAALDRAALRLSTAVFDQPPWAVLNARTLRLEGDAEAALAILNRLSDGPAASRALLLERVRALAAAGEGELAMAQIAEAIVTDPAGEAPSLVALYSDVAGQDDWPDGALDRLRDALPSQPPPGVALELARAELSAGLPEAARVRATALAASGSGAAQALRIGAFQLLAALDQRSGDNAAARARIREALALAPADESLWLTLAAYTHDPGSHAHGAAERAGHDKLRDVLMEARDAVSESATIRAELGIIDFTAGKPESAARLFREALDRAPQRPEINLLAALAFADAGGDLERAEAMARFALEADPRSAAAMDAVGWVLFRKGEDPADALDWIDRALAVEPNDGTTLRHRAEVLQALGRGGDAAKVAMTALGDELAAHDRKAAREILLSERPADTVTAPVAALTPAGIGARLGEAVFTSGAEDKLSVRITATDLPPGRNAVHVHEVASCMPGPDGALGGASGPHYDIDHGGMAGGDMQAAINMAKAESELKDGDGDDMQMSSGAGKMMPRGDLEPVEADADGRVDSVIDSGWLSLEEVRGRSLMIHSGMGPDGGGGPKFACVLID